MFRVDPTKTLTIRKRFMADITRRFKKVRRLIIESVAINDCFGLSEKSPHLSLLQALEPDVFKFSRSAEKISGFMTWLKEAENAEILTTSVIPGIGPSIESAWTDVYISNGYRKGIANAKAQLKKVGLNPEDSITGGPMFQDPVNAAFTMPIHADAVGALYTRTFSELKGITAAMDQQISRVLAEGLSQGTGPRELGKILAERVDKIGIVRGQALARTEIIRAHHLANIQEYQNAGLVGVTVQAEWLTAGYNVCPVCSQLQGKVFTLEEIKPLIPRHPNCRCMALPWKEEWGKKHIKDSVKIG